MSDSAPANLPKIVGIFLLLATVLFICSAGCISIGSQTTDIMIGDTVAGTITITPTENLFSPNASIGERFDVEIVLFGIKYSKGGLSKSESEALMSQVSSQTLNTEKLSELLSGFSLNEPSMDKESFFDQIINMPISAENTKTVSESIDMSAGAESISSIAAKLEEILS